MEKFSIYFNQGLGLPPFLAGILFIPYGFGNSSHLLQVRFV